MAGSLIAARREEIFPDGLTFVFCLDMCAADVWKRLVGWQGEIGIEVHFVRPQSQLTIGPQHPKQVLLVWD